MFPLQPGSVISAAAPPSEVNDSASVQTNNTNNYRSHTLHLSRLLLLRPAEADDTSTPPPPHTSSLKSWWVINERNVQPGRRCRLITGSLQGSHKYGGGYQTGCYVDGGVICLTDCVCLWWSCRLKSFVWLQSLVMMHTVLSSPEVHFYSPLYQQVHLLVLIKQQQREATSSDTTKLKLVLVSAH